MSAEQLDMGTSGLAGRQVLEIAVLRGLSVRSDVRGLVRFALHLFCMGLTGALVWLARGSWWTLVPAMFVHGFTIVTMFAPMHECVHRTAFDSRWLNEVFGWLAGLLGFYNFTYYRYYHTWHHRYTQDPARDPELSTPKPTTTLGYLYEISGLNFWLMRPLLFVKLTLGITKGYPFIPDNGRGKVALSAAVQLLIYIGAFAVAPALGFPQAIFFWLLPAMLAQPLLRMMLIVEHTGCTHDENGLTNTRTTLTNHIVRLLMWNMSFHAEHHLYPSIPFHRLPAAHLELQKRITHIAPNYVAANRDVLHAITHGQA